MSDEMNLPIIDLSGYLNPESPEDRERIIAQVRDASRQYGFFQVQGHGVPPSLQHDIIRSMGNLFSLPEEEKLQMSFLQNPCRRGYEAAGMSLREGDPLPDSKECFYIARDDPIIELAGFNGPNLWPNLPTEDFRDPVWKYYEQTSELGKTIWSILLEGLGQPPSLVEKFAHRAIVPMKMIRYPPQSSTLPGQFGIGAHTDFGGVTILFQQPGKDGLEVWHEGKEAWIEVPALEDVYKSARHRVINKSQGERLSCATFWHGDINATNPLNPDDLNSETVGQLLVKRFRNQYSMTKESIAQVGAA
ncbi:Oxoglutarate/iron-dependent oxygenase [Penicillium camemberti]|uniref:Oxoglutarate/iron-dependent oxygenase n=1 Tax=Penicillium camemberti (strain FM 013) TaxID=1429867 RepID=A0A0G4NTL7_PENC3|nr:Oxoglutarate/iron-dependent oxygenase [Penicillium camemberti]